MKFASLTSSTQAGNDTNDSNNNKKACWQETLVSVGFWPRSLFQLDRKQHVPKANRLKLISSPPPRIEAGLEGRSLQGSTSTLSIHSWEFLWETNKVSIDRSIDWSSQGVSPQHFPCRDNIGPVLRPYDLVCQCSSFTLLYSLTNV